MVYKQSNGEIDVNKPYVPIQISSIENGMKVNSSSLVDTGADKLVVSHELVKKLNMKVKPTSTRAKDAGSCLLLILGDVTLNFSCHCLCQREERSKADCSSPGTPKKRIFSTL